MIYKRAWAEINLSAILQNLATVRAHIGLGSSIMGVVKADAYGHGAVPVAHTLVNGGVESLGVAICEEGVELRESGIKSKILIMGYTPEPMQYEALQLDLTQTIFSLSAANVLAARAKSLNMRATVHIKIDTGMSRLGFLPNSASVEQICEIAQNPNLHVAGIYTHLATSDILEDPFMYIQLEAFNSFIKKLETRGLFIGNKHIANSGALSHICAGGNYQNFGIDMVRVGIMLYGHPPSGEMANSCAHLGLVPAMRLMSHVSMVKELEAGVGISYGHIYKTTRKSTIAVLPIGYADGYPRRLSHGGKVLIGGKFAPIAGAICMDQCMIDVTDIPGIKAGDPVVMMGVPGIDASNLANTVGTISYEILCGVGKRVPRVYV